MPITRSPAQKSACKDLRRNDQSPVITPEATIRTSGAMTKARSSRLRPLVRFYAHNALASPETCT
ncbi:Conserved protein [Lacticaseibacillus rhamnosus Lc 705]|nr:Conserved protein [Lacticaseibacillus rhamnosus Lc 705]